METKNLQINFNPILSNLEDTIQEFLENKINKQKQHLTKDIYNQIRNQLVKQLNGEKDLFTPNYQQNFYTKFMNQFDSIHFKPRFPDLISNLDKDEYIIAIIGDCTTLSHPRSGYGIKIIPPICYFNYIKTITNKMNINEYIGTVLIDQMPGGKFIKNEIKHNLILNDLQIDLIMKLSNKFNYSERSGKLLGVINNIKFEKLQQEKKKLDAQQILISTDANKIIQAEKQPNIMKLWENVINGKNHHTALLNTDLQNLAIKIVEINDKREINQKHIEFQRPCFTINHLVGIDYDSITYTQYHQSRNRLNNNGKGYCHSDITQAKYNLYDDVIDHLVYMFKTYWNGKILSPYAKEIKAENDKLKLEAREIKTENDKLKLEAKEIEAENDKLNLEANEIKAENDKLKLEANIKVENDKLKLEANIKAENDKLKLEATIKTRCNAHTAAMTRKSDRHQNARHKSMKRDKLYFDDEALSTSTKIKKQQQPTKQFMTTVTHQCARLVLLGEDGENPPAGVPSLILLTEERTTIGRSRTADITMDSVRYPMTLSRSHLCIWREYISSGNYQWHVCDLNALNGTFIGCVKVGDSVINDGEILTIGGGAGLELSERSDLLASDLVFRFEVIFDDEKGAPGELTSSSDTINTEPTTMPSLGNTAERKGTTYDLMLMPSELQAAIVSNNMLAAEQEDINDNDSNWSIEALCDDKPCNLFYDHLHCQ